MEKKFRWFSIKKPCFLYFHGLGVVLLKSVPPLWFFKPYYFHLWAKREKQPTVHYLSQLQKGHFWYLMGMFQSVVTAWWKGLTWHTHYCFTVKKDAMMTEKYIGLNCWGLLLVWFGFSGIFKIKKTRCDGLIKTFSSIVNSCAVRVFEEGKKPILLLKWVNYLPADLMGGWDRREELSGK